MLEVVPLTRHVGAEIRGVDLRRETDPATAAELYAAWLDHLVLHIYEHVWRAGDLLIRDNRCTLHARIDFDPAQRRVLRRVAIKGTRPVAAVQAA